MKEYASGFCLNRHVAFYRLSKERAVCFEYAHSDDKGEIQCSFFPFSFATGKQQDVTQLIFLLCLYLVAAKIWMLLQRNLYFMIVFAMGIPP